MPLDRFNAFSDGVFAIAITLLVLELTVPAGPERLLPALVEQRPEFLGYLISSRSSVAAGSPTHG